jgi:hypothetical protein
MYMILISHLRIDLTSGPFPSGFQINILHVGYTIIDLFRFVGRKCL